MTDIRQQLNEAQWEAVSYCDGPSLVIAGAGSGKTRVLTYKIAYLIKGGLPPWNILALTFTNKAAREMNSRIAEVAGTDATRWLWSGTFHSIFARILRQEAETIGFPHDFTIYDTADSRSLIKAIVKEMQLDDKLYKAPTVAARISEAKNALVLPEAYCADPSVGKRDQMDGIPKVGKIYAAYCARCRVAAAMDFDDLLLNTFLLLRDHPEVRRKYMERFQYILVDEYQDTNVAQHRIINLLTTPDSRVCVVGDDAQSIYAFRGARIDNILGFSEQYPKARLIKLERNYRSTQTIVGAANSIIRHNSEQIPKKVYSEAEVGDPIKVFSAYSDKDESARITGEIRRLHRRCSVGYDEIALLYRTNAQSRVLEEALRKRNIPYRIYGGLAFYQRKEIKDAVAYLRLSVNPDDDEALRRVINTPARGIGDTTVKKLTAAAMRDACSMWQVLDAPDSHPLDVNRGTRAKLEGFHNLILDFTAKAADGIAADELAEYILAATGLIANLVHDKTPESISQIENLQELLNGVRQFVADKREESGDDAAAADMASFLTEVSLATDQDGKDPDDGASERVTLMTIHAAKGLEFGNVFIVGAEEELLPSHMSFDSLSGIEEERRLMYVAITRAKRFCMISYAASRFINGQTKIGRPSRFLRDIDPRYLQMVSGATIAGPQRSADSFRSSFHSPAPAPRRTVSTPQQPAPAPAPAPAAASADADGYSLHSSSEVSPGTVIEHQRFGRGTVLEIDTAALDHRIRVQFDQVEPRVLLLKFAKFKILS